MISRFQFAFVLLIATACLADGTLATRLHALAIDSKAIDEPTKVFKTHVSEFEAKVLAAGAKHPSDASYRLASAKEFSGLLTALKQFPGTPKATFEGTKLFAAAETKSLTGDDVSELYALRQPPYMALQTVFGLLAKSAGPLKVKPAQRKEVVAQLKRLLGHDPRPVNVVEAMVWGSIVQDLATNRFFANLPGSTLSQFKIAVEAEGDRIRRLWKDEHPDFDKLSDAQKVKLWAQTAPAIQTEYRNGEALMKHLHAVLSSLEKK